MSYRTKLVFLFSALALFTSALLVSLMFLGARSRLREQMNTTAMSIATTSAILVDPDLHESIRSTNDQASAAYQQIEKVLRNARDRNRRGDVDVRFIFTLRPVGDKAGQMQFVVDAEEPGKDKSNVGEVYVFRGQNARPLPFGETMVQPEFIQDEWGTWLEAYAPVRDRNGKTIATLGVDLKASDVVRRLNLLLFNGGLALGVSVILGLVLALMLARWMSRPLAVLDTALKSIGNGDLTTQVDIKSRDEFGEVAKTINSMVVGLRQRESLKDGFARYVSSHVAETILASGQAPELRGERRRITVLFSDVRNFTTLSEKMPPELVVTFLNEYFAQMIDVLTQHQGELDKIIGDGLMGLFGAPKDDPQHEAHALKAALQMRQVITRLQDKWRNEQDLEIRIGIGIHTGPAIVGNIGSMQKMQYTAIGDTVNLAARLESSTKELETDIVVSEETVSAVRDQFEFKPLKSIRVKGREAEVMVYSVIQERAPKA